jgi:hypothetical protein
MRWPCGVRIGTTKTELMLRTYQPKLASRNRPQRCRHHPSPRQDIIVGVKRT